MVKMAETDLHILAAEKVDEQALQLVTDVRLQIEQYIARRQCFLDALVPLPMDERAPEVVREMLAAGLQAGVGPMAAVAGAIAQRVGRMLLAGGQVEVIVENGGDLYLARNRTCTVAVYAGESSLSGRLGISLQPDGMPCGVCCSSGTIGHSLSMGNADAVVVVASDTALADAAATRLGNEAGKSRQSINQALALAGKIEGIRGVVIVSGDRLGAWGDIELVRI
ncbi:MAG: UPF0280 family protein [Desulfocapsa sp.]|nr:MAG: UPF0280 family protein [Desulfocapsa sp.]